MEIRNIFCVGRNYGLHARELGNEVPSEPMLFTKPTHAVVWADGQAISLPKNVGAIHHEVEIVLHIGREYQSGLTVDELADWMAIGIDFTLRDVQTQLKQQGYPWLRAKGFLNSAVLTRPIPFPGVRACEEKVFALHRNGLQVQIGNIREMTYSIQTIVDFTAQHFGLGVGDILFTGTPNGVGPVGQGDVLNLLWDHQEVGKITIL